jgi:hypothetical protein
MIPTIVTVTVTVTVTVIAILMLVEVFVQHEGGAVGPFGSRDAFGVERTSPAPVGILSSPKDVTKAQVRAR